MSLGSVGPASFFHQTAGPSSVQTPDKGPRAEAAKEQDEAQAKRVMTPEEEEERRKTLAAMATQEFRDILEADAQRREDQGLSPTGVVVNLTA
jgi:hypothetical protein